MAPRRVLQASLDRLRWLAAAKSGTSAVAQTVVSRFLLMGLNLLNGVYIARHLGPAGRGTQAAIGLWPALVCYMLTLGVPAALRYQARKHEAQRDSLFSAAIVLAALLGVVAMLAGIAITPIAMKHYGPQDILGAQALMLFAPIVMLTYVLNAILEVRFDFTFTNLTAYAPPFVTYLILVALVHAHRLTPFNASLGYTIPTALTSVWMGVYLLGKFRLTFVDFARSLRRLIGYGIKIYGANVVVQFSTQIDQLLVIGFLSARDLGLYTVSLQASRVLQMIPASLYLVLVPKMAGRPTHQIVATTGRAARLTVFVTLLGGLALLALLPILVPGFYGNKFAPSILVAQLLLGESVLGAATAVLLQTFTASGRPMVVTMLQGLGLAAAVPLMLVLIPRFGIFGAAISLLASTSLRFVSVMLLYPLLLKVPIPNLVLRSDDVRYLLRTVRSESAKGAA